MDSRAQEVEETIHLLAEMERACPAKFFSIERALTAMADVRSRSQSGTITSRATSTSTEEALKFVAGVPSTTAERLEAAGYGTVADLAALSGVTRREAEIVDSISSSFDPE